MNKSLKLINKYIIETGGYTQVKVRVYNEELCNISNSIIDEYKSIKEELLSVINSMPDSVHKNNLLVKLSTL